jgi:uncharacterized membrane protein YphA (DoxX/SURF4 family)
VRARLPVVVVLVIRIVLAAVFTLAAAGKAFDPAGSREAAAGFGVSDRAAGLVGILLPAFEGVIGVGLVLQPTARVAAGAALVLLMVFIVAIARLMRAGQAPECHCFGQIHSEPAGPSTLARNSMLGVLAAVALAGGPGRSLATVSASTVAVLLLSVLTGGLTLVTIGLWRENRRLRTHPMPPVAPVAENGLTIGTRAPDLAVRDRAGTAAGLHDHFAVARPVVLVSVSAQCGPCVSLLPELARWRTQLAGTLEILTLSAGTVELNETLLAGAPDHHLLLADPGAFLTAYKIAPTPSAVAIDQAGRIASRPASGALAIEALIRTVLDHEPVPDPVGVTQH